MKSYYINTDLDIASNDDLSHLIPIFDEKCDLLNSGHEDGQWYICVEADGSGIRGVNDSPENDISGLLKVIDGFDEVSKELLKSARTFDFNVGW